ncbi:MAP kinase phosphatase, partial [Reticulomyxa filosa]
SIQLLQGVCRCLLVSSTSSLPSASTTTSAALLPANTSSSSPNHLSNTSAIPTSQSKQQEVPLADSNGAISSSSANVYRDNVRDVNIGTKEHYPFSTSLNNDNNSNNRNNNNNNNDNNNNSNNNNNNNNSINNNSGINKHRQDWRDRGESLYEMPHDELFCVKTPKDATKASQNSPMESQAKSEDEPFATLSEKAEKKGHGGTHHRPSPGMFLANTVLPNVSDDTVPTSGAPHQSPSDSYTNSPYANSSGSSVQSSPQMGAHARGGGGIHHHGVGRSGHSPAITIQPVGNAGKGIGMKPLRHKHNRHKKNKIHDDNTQRTTSSGGRQSFDAVSPPQSSGGDVPTRSVRSKGHLPGAIPDVFDFDSTDNNEPPPPPPFLENLDKTSSSNTQKKVCFPKSIFLKREVLAEVNDLLQGYMLSDIRMQSDKCLPKHLKTIPFVSFAYPPEQEAYRSLSRDYESVIPAINLIQNWNNKWSILVSLDNGDGSATQ